MLLIFLFVLALVPAAIAAMKGRSAFGFFVYGLFLLPVAIIHALLAAPASREERVRKEGRVPCPVCSEAILPAAKLCPHCRSNLTGEHQQAIVAAISPFEPKPISRNAMAVFLSVVILVIVAMIIKGRVIG